LDEIDELPGREFEAWSRYWNEEPWGPYRDNMHAAMLAVQFIRPHLKEGTKVPPIAEFMFRIPDEKPVSGFRSLVASLERKSRRPKAIRR
jgi:hypothetical protein